MNKKKEKFNLVGNVQALFNYLTISKFPGIFRPGSSPFLTGDTLRNYSDHIYDETGIFNPSNVKKNDLVFLKTDYLKTYFQNQHKFINEPYILITHNSDIGIEKNHHQWIDEKIIHWFAMNLNKEITKKISPLPIGIENRRFLKNGKVANFKKAISFQNNRLEKNDSKIFCSFNVKTNYEHRSKLLQQVKEDEKIIFKQFSKNKEYLFELSKYKYNVCPSGNNYDTHRVWESLIFGCTPIVTANQVNNNLFEQGVPLIILNNWNQLKSMTINDINHMNKVNLEKNFAEFSTFDYWEKIIISKKQ